MTWLLLATLGALAAPAEELDAPDARSEPVRLERPARRGGVHLPPLRIDTRATLRDQVVPGALLEVGMQLDRTRHWAFDANFAGAAGRGLELPGPWRSFTTFELTCDALYTVNRWVEVGPAFGMGYRLFRQQGTAIDEAWVPMAGLRGSVALLKSRKFGILLTSRVMAEGTITRMVLETQQVATLSPFEGQVGLRIVFGHGRPPAEAE